MEGCAAAADHGSTAKIKREVEPWNGQILCIWCAPASKNSAENNSAYRRSVAALPPWATPGWWVVLSSHWRWWPGRCRSCCKGVFRLGLVLLLLAAGGLLWVSLRALWVRIAPPEGEEITAEDAPELFQALERIRRKVKGPAIHHVLLSDEFNASIQQIPRYGLFGGGTNYLVIGLPLLMALDRGRFFVGAGSTNTATCAATMAALAPGSTAPAGPGCS